MSEDQKDGGLISVFVDDKEVRCKPGTNLVDLVASVEQNIKKNKKKRRTK